MANEENTGSIELTPNYDNLFAQFSREAKLKADTIMADFPGTLDALDDYRANIIRRDVLQAFGYVLNAINICAQSTVRLRAEDLLRLRELIHDCTTSIQTKAAEYERKVAAEDEPEEDTPDYLRPLAEEEESDEPDEDAITTTDHRQFYQYNKLVFEITEDDGVYSVIIAGGAKILSDTFDTVESAVRAYMDAVQFWPDCWWISDHGNAHRMNLSTEDK